MPDQDEHPVHPIDYDFLYDDLEGLNFSDSGPEMDDNLSIVSTPKPKLRFVQTLFWTCSFPLGNRYGITGLNIKFLQLHQYE